MKLIFVISEICTYVKYVCKLSCLNVLNFFWQSFKPFNSLSELAKHAKTAQPYVRSGSALSLQRA